MGEFGIMSVLDSFIGSVGGIAYFWLGCLNLFNNLCKYLVCSQFFTDFRLKYQGL